MYRIIQFQWIRVIQSFMFLWQLYIRSMDWINLIRSEISFCQCAWLPDLLSMKLGHNPCFVQCIWWSSIIKLYGCVASTMLLKFGWLSWWPRVPFISSVSTLAQCYVHMIIRPTSSRCARVYVCVPEWYHISTFSQIGCIMYSFRACL